MFYFNDFKPHDGPAICDDLMNKIQDLTGNLNWYDLFRENYGVNDTEQATDFYGNDLEDRRVGKTFSKHGEELTYKRGFTFKEYTGRWLKGHPGNFVK